MDNVQKRNIWANVSSSKTFRSYLCSKITIDWYDVDASIR
jgi:hypothetical protein